MTQDADLPRIAVVGSGYMGGGMAQVFALHGYSCVIADASAEIALASLARLVREAREFEADGLFPNGSADLIEARLECAESIEDAAAENLARAGNQNR